MLDCRAAIGESPTWFAGGGALFWIDIKEPALHCLNADGGNRRWSLPSDIGAFALLEGAGGALVALRDGIFSLDFTSGATSLLAAAPHDPQLFRFNEGICDAQGRFWVGMMFDPLLRRTKGEIEKKRVLHQFTFAHGLVAAADESDLHNGFAWNDQSDEFFWSHSRERRVYRASYELATGAIGRPSGFVEIRDGNGVPDGAAMDEEGCYWCAIHGASALHRYDAGGNLVLRIALPVSRPTMCAFIGPNLDEMVVTSAREHLTSEQLAREPCAGSLFRLRPGVRGLARPCVVQ
ncbi:MAG TPA: SMP-30/gluconolactonase/LRE family protein [Steroidobacteraceae bacterium]|jgi:sugar lactone lactonase YvrE|nr:SMP-30/gluconolactonase/LRE family protein [Steroidobacteraceae bacterium]